MNSAPQSAEKPNVNPNFKFRARLAFFVPRPVELQMQNSQPLLIPQHKFMALTGINRKKFSRIKKAGGWPDPITTIGIIPYFNRAECAACIRGEWTAETREEWRATHRNEMLGLPTEPTSNPEVAA